jgi:sRNA-binding regulator protein Hfq
VHPPGADFCGATLALNQTWRGAIMDRTPGRPGHRPHPPRPAHLRVQPFSRPGYPDSTLTSHAAHEMERSELHGQRRLVRTPLPEPGEGYGPKRAPRRAAPPEQTNAEEFYYLKQMNARTPMVVVLQDGEELRGVIEWYDRGSIKVHRDGAPNVLILKHAIKYLYKAEEEKGRPHPERERSSNL